MLYLIEQFHQK